MIGTTETAERLGISSERVRALIKAGRLPAKKLGRDWFVEEKDLALVKNRKPGRPRKNTTAKKGKPGQSRSKTFVKSLR